MDASPVDQTLMIELSDAIIDAQEVNMAVAIRYAIEGKKG